MIEIFPERADSKGPWRVILVWIAALALTGCAAHIDTHEQGVGTAAAPTEAGETAPSRSLTADELYELLVAEFALKRRDLPVAVQRYLNAARTTGDAGVAERATRVAVFARDEAAALQAADFWVDAKPESIHARAIRTALLIRLGQTGPAAGNLEDLIKRIEKPGVGGLSLLTDMLGRGKDKKAALETLRQVAPKFETDPGSLFILASLAAQLGDTEGAMDSLNKVHAQDPDNARAIVLHAQVLRADKKTSEAAAFLGGALERIEGSHDIRLTYARLLVQLKRYEDARREFETLAKELPKNADVRFALGLLLLQTDKPFAAKAQFTALIDLGKRKRAANFYLGQISEVEKKPDIARKHYQRVDRGEHYVNAQVRVAVIFAEQKRLDRAREHLAGVRRRNASDAVRLYRTEAELLVKNKRYEQAVDVYNYGVDEFPNNTDLLYARAMLAEKLDRLDHMERDLRAVIELEPSNADAMNALGYVLADRTDRLEEAEKLIARALTLKPEDHYIIDSMGWVLYRRGKLDQALEHLRRAMKLNEDPEIAAHLGEVLWVMGRKEAARKVWNSALKSTPEDQRLLDVIKRFEK